MRLAPLVVLALCSMGGTVAGMERSWPDRGCPLEVVRVELDGRETLEWIASWTEPWEVAPAGAWVVIGLAEDGRRRLEDAGLTFEIDRLRTDEICRVLVGKLGVDGAVSGFPCYRTINDAYRQAAAMATAHPQLAEWLDIGDSWEKQATGGTEGHDLRVLRLTNRAITGSGAPTADDRKPVMLVFSGVHARQLAPVEVVMRFAEQLLLGYGRDARATWLLDEHEIHLVPVANPDGRIRAETIVPWRKNADNDYCTDSPLRGVDLNRNFEHAWGCCGGSSSDPCSEIFRGPAGGSEPETLAYQTWMEAVFPDQWDPEPTNGATGVFIDVHSYGELVLWPWGSTPDPAPNAGGLETLGRRLAFRLGARPQQSFDLYPSDGTTDDHAYGRFGVAAFGFEIGTRFFESCPTFENQIVGPALDALWYAARVARTPYVTPDGPDMRNVIITPRPDVPAGTPIVVSAVADDRGLAGPGSAAPSAVVEAEMWLGEPPWRSGSAPVPMAPADGVWDDTWEAVEAEIDTGSLPSGRHLVYLRARGADGTWGPVAAALLWIDVARELPRRVASDARRRP
jgi:hypothetical protein